MRGRSIDAEQGDSRQFVWARRLELAHNLGGNRMRNVKVVRISYDNSWRHRLTLFEKVWIPIVTSPSAVCFELGRLLHRLTRRHRSRFQLPQTSVSASE